MIRALYRTHDGRLRVDLAPDEFADALRDTRGLMWVDFSNEPAHVCEPIFRETFGFHPLAIDDALHESHVPKLDDWEQYLYIVLHTIAYRADGNGNTQTLELDLFLGKNYLVTYREHAINAVDRVWSACQRDARHLARGADHLLYKLADELVASYMGVVDDMDEAIEQFQDQVFDDPRSETLEQLFTLKRALMHLRRTVAPQREVLNKLARDEYAVVDVKARVFFRDVYDHLVRLYDIIEGMRDLVSGALDTYLSVVNNRMNEVMKILTIITTMFMPISFLASFFGMNFFQPVTPLEAWTDQPAFWLTLAVMILTPTGIYLWLRRRGWM